MTYRFVNKKTVLPLPSTATACSCISSLSVHHTYHVAVALIHTALPLWQYHVYLLPSHCTQSILSRTPPTAPSFALPCLICPFLPILLCTVQRYPTLLYRTLPYLATNFLLCPALLWLPRFIAGSCIDVFAPGYNILSACASSTCKTTTSYIVESGKSHTHLRSHTFM